jgi:hypothetical protein
MISRTDSDAPHITGKGAPADKNNGLPRALFLLVELGFFLGLNCVRHQDSFISRLSLQCSALDQPLDQLGFQSDFRTN